MHVFILAGGYATRQWPLTEHRAKPLLPLCGKPLLTYIIEGLPKDAAITVSTNAVFEEDFLRWKATIDHPHMSVVIEETKGDDDKLGALGATAQWIRKENIDEDVLLLTGDNYFGFSFDLFLQETTAGCPVLASYDISDKMRAMHLGVVTVDVDSKQVLSFEEKPRDPRSTLVSTGCFFVPRTFLPVLLDHADKHPDNVGGLFEEFLRRGVHVRAFTFHEPWFDIGSFEAYLEATRLLADHKAIIDPSATVKNVTTEGAVVVGPGCTVTDSTLRDCVLFAGSTIDNCVLQECIVDEQCTLRGVDITRQMVRTKTVLTRT